MLFRVPKNLCVNPMTLIVHNCTIPYHTIPLGVSGVLLPNIESISTGCNTCLLGFIFCGQVLQIFAVILSYKPRLQGECDPLKISSIGLYPRFWPFTLWIIHHKLLKIGYLARPFDLYNWSGTAIRRNATDIHLWGSNSEDAFWALVHYSYMKVTATGMV